MSKLSEQDRRDLSKALSYANWSALGIIIPFVGWLLAGMALSFIKTIPLTDESRARIQQIKRAAWIGIVISSLAIAAWGGYYKYQQSQELKKQNETQQIKTSEFEEKNKRQMSAQAGLSNCLYKAGKSYSDGFKAESIRLGITDGTLPRENANRWDSILKANKDDCYRQFDSGLFDYYINN